MRMVLEEEWRAEREECARRVDESLAEKLRELERLRERDRSIRLAIVPTESDAIRTTRTVIPA